MSGTVIKTERLILRRAQLDDLEDLHAVFSNPEAMRYWDSRPFQAIAQTQSLLDGMISSGPPKSDDFVVEHRGRAIGKAGCWGQGEIGFILHPDSWGMGLAREALEAAIPHIFKTLPIEKLLADVDPRNVASLKTLSGLGFVEFARKARTIQVGDEWCDSVYLELLRPTSALPQT